MAAAGAALYLGPDIAVTSVLGLGVGLIGLASNAGASLLGRVVNRDAALSPLAVTAPSMAVGGTVALVTGLLLDGMPHLTLATWASSRGWPS